VDTNILPTTPEKVATPTEESPHACMGGWVFLGYEDEDGQEHYEAVPCRRCRPESA
jgi:hypothetical protein